MELKLTILQIGCEFVLLSWSKPEYDGGSTIIGYYIEKRELTGEKWLKCNFENVSDTEYKVSMLTEDKTYQFRVKAKNAIGN